MPTLHLAFLGPPLVTAGVPDAGAEPLTFATRKSLALLIYLVAESGASGSVAAGARAAPEPMHRREKLAALLWPESDSSRSRANLRSALNYLRAALPETPDGATPHLHIERDRLGFNPTAPHTLDLALVQQALASRDPDEMAAAAAHGRGSFAAGFSPGDAPPFDAWIAAQRALWEQRVDLLFDRLSQAQFEQGQVAEAQATLLRWLEQNPLAEAAYRRQMQVQLARGDRAAALRTYQTCRERLQEALDVPPAPETEAMAAQVRHAPLAGRAGRRHTTTAHRPTPSRPSFDDGPLVGREAPFRRLVEAYHTAARGGPRIVVLGGEAGIGKSRLVQEFLAWVEAQSGEALLARSFENRRQVPYQPLVGALRPRMERLNAPEDLLGDVWLRELSRLLPELLERYPDLAPSEGAPAAGEETARTRLYEALNRFFTALADRLPPGQALVLAVDDLQYADVTSLDVLQHMAAEWAQARTPLLLLLAGWSAGPVTDHELGVWMQGLSRLLPLTTLHLRPLDAADTAAFVDDFAEDVDASFVQRLHTATAGHPFFLVETLKALLEQRVLALRPTEAGAPDVVLTERAQEWVADQEITLTERMHRLIRTRLARVGNNSRDLLTAAAVLGEDAHFKHLCAVADLREGEALRCLDDLLQRDLLREQTNGVGAERYTLPHGVIAGVVYGDAAVARRRIFHRRALTALSAAGHPSATLARHARAARLPEATLRHLLAAGEEALALHASEQAVDHFQHARTLLGIEHRLGRQARPDAGALWARDLRPEPAALERLYTGLGRARELAGDYEGALAAYGELQELAQARDDRHLELAALMARTTVYAAPTRYYDPQHVTVLTEQALPLARALEDRAAEAKIEWNLLLLRLFTGEAARAVEHGERSLTLARQEGLREQTAYALHDLVRAYLFTGRPEDAGAAGEEAQSLWRALDNRAMLADNLTSTTSILIFAEARLAEARARIDEALALSREIGNLWNQSYAYHILGTLHFYQGRLGQALDANRRAVELGEQSGFYVPLFANGALQAWIYAYVGRPDLALPWVERALAETGDAHFQELSVGVYAALAYVRLRQGDQGAAEAALAEAHERLQLHSLASPAFYLYPIEAEVALAAGNPQRALRAAADMEAFLDGARMALFRDDAAAIRGRALLLQGRLEEAHAALHKALQTAEAVGARRTRLAAHTALADLAARRDDPDRAHTHRQAAAALAHALADSLHDPTLRHSFLTTHNIPLDPA